MEVQRVTSYIACKLGAVGKILIAMMVFATAAVMTAGSANAAPASAPAVTAIQTITPDVDSHGCAAHSLCMWVNAGFSGTKFQKTFGDVPSDTWLFVGSVNGSTFNDKASSLDNNRGFASGIAKNAPANLPDAFCFKGGVTISNFAGGFWPDGFSPLNDSVSSYLLSSDNTGCTRP